MAGCADKFNPDGLRGYIFTEMIVIYFQPIILKQRRGAPQSCWRTDERWKNSILVLTVDSSFCFLPRINSLGIPRLSGVQTTYC